MNTKFKIGDIITIKYDKYYDYGLLLGKQGEIISTGPIKKGVMTYNVEIPNRIINIIKVFEPDIIKENE